MNPDSLHVHVHKQHITGQVRCQDKLDVNLKIVTLFSAFMR